MYLEKIYIDIYLCGVMANEKLVRTAVMITEEQHQWLKENEDLNFSGFVRMKLYGRMMAMDTEDLFGDGIEAVKKLMEK